MKDFVGAVVSLSVFLTLFSRDTSPAVMWITSSIVGLAVLICVVDYWSRHT